LTDKKTGLAKQPMTERARKAKATKPMTRFLGNGQRPTGTMIIMAHTSSVYAILSGRRRAFSLSAEYLTSEARSRRADLKMNEF
jgi:hypothetical protein